ncbi:distal tail protein Dit [Priestia endophytica]|uniref:distal tail protein Dit n=1 Tax=Priestia endophytica TaxID=135735 RepID=UPI00203C2702|nr:distal tail protein Dit [Priestia endophytica]MCM3536602.1 phage tail family protein [Priestia endophytica]
MFFVGKGIKSFAGREVPAELLIEKVEYELMPSANVTTKDVPMMDGQVFVYKEYGIRTVTADVTFKGTSKPELLKEAATTLVNWLNYRTPQDFVLRDLPDRKFQAVLTSNVPFERIEHLGRATLTFTMYDPYGESLEGKTYALQPGTTAIVNEGTAEAFPIITFTLKKNTTYFFVTGAEQTIYFGEPHDPSTTTVYDDEPIIFEDNCSDVTLWSQATGRNVDGGQIMGQISSNGYSFAQANKDYGELVGKWHGGGVVRSIGKEVQDFELAANVGFFSRLGYPNERGRIEIYLLDINDRAVGKMSIKDIDAALDNPMFDCFMGQLGNGGVNIANTWGDYKGVFKQFDGIIKIGRRGKTWFCYIGKYKDDWSQDTRFYNSQYATIDDHMRKVAKIHVHIAQFSNIPYVTSMWVNWLKMKEYKSAQENTVNYVGRAGDEFAINCETGEIFRNGSYIGVQYAGTEFIRLKPGANGISFSDPDLIESGSLTFKERWL